MKYPLSNSEWEELMSTVIDERPEEPACEAIEKIREERMWMLGALEKKRGARRDAAERATS